MSFLRVELRTNEYTSGKVDEIVLLGYDLHLRKQITCERDVRLARRMAGELGIEFADMREGIDIRPYSWFNTPAKLRPE